MRITRRYIAAAGALVFAAASLPSFSHAESADEAAVKKATDDLYKAFKAADAAKLEALLVDQLSYGHSDGRIDTKATLIDFYVGPKKPVVKSIVITEPTVTVVGNNAIARHMAAFEWESDGKPGSTKVPVMLIWTKDGGTWKLLARQTFRPPS
jgi:ketosteroid isomerase-like protein